MQVHVSLADGAKSGFLRHGDVSLTGELDMMPTNLISLKVVPSPYTQQTQDGPGVCISAPDHARGNNDEMQHVETGVRNKVGFDRS
jgi:hypothetical protein